MKYLKLFENHISEAEVAKICQQYNIKNWSLNSDGLVDVIGDVNFSGFKLVKLPLKFGRVEGNFICAVNNLTSLEGCPNYVGGDFNYGYNKLTSLIGCPQYVGRDFICRSNNIKSFEGIGIIGRSIYCIGNPIYPLWILFNDVSLINQFNEWGIIQGDNVILYRLNDFLEEIGKSEINKPFTATSIRYIQKYYNVI